MGHINIRVPAELEEALPLANPAVDCGMGSPSCYGRIDGAEATAGPVQPSTR